MWAGISGADRIFFTAANGRFAKTLVYGRLPGKIVSVSTAMSVLARAYQGGEVYGDDYARALTDSKIGFRFLRKVGPDQHTTRSFEIPGMWQPARS